MFVCRRQKQSYLFPTIYGMQYHRKLLPLFLRSTINCKALKMFVRTTFISSIFAVNQLEITNRSQFFIFRSRPVLPYRKQASASLQECISGRRGGEVQTNHRRRDVQHRVSVYRNKARSVEYWLSTDVVCI